MRYRTNYDPDSLQLAPFFLLPSAFPRREFERVVKLQSIVNILMHRIAHDYQFLKDALEKYVENTKEVYINDNKYLLEITTELNFINFN